ncbi:MAG: hypothetical protein KAI55_04080 [Candidatus Aenigmarchaeota archaeon]|nr:hypothetical protein [Candidatus Aenigmarchaeota archaeon]
MVPCTKNKEKQGFHRWAWSIVFFMGGLLMIFGGAQDITLFFSPDGNLAPVPSWHSVSPIIGLICGVIVLISAGLNIIWGWQLRFAKGIKEIKIAQRVALISIMAMVADWICGYYGFGSLMALLTSLWLIHPAHRRIDKYIK